MRNPIPTPYCVKPLKRLAGINPEVDPSFGVTPRQAAHVPPVQGKSKGHRAERPGPCKWLTHLPRVRLGAISSAAALALAGVLTLATVVARLAAAVALTGILSLAGVLLLKELGGNLAVGGGGNGIGGGCVLGDYRIAGHETGQRGAHHQ